MTTPAGTLTNEWVEGLAKACTDMKFGTKQREDRPEIAAINDSFFELAISNYIASHAPNETGIKPDNAQAARHELVAQSKSSTQTLSGASCNKARAECACINAETCTAITAFEGGISRANLQSRERRMNKDQRRYDLLQQIGCIACSREGAGYAAPDCHHIVEGNKRLGDEYTLPLCPWHHRGVRLAKPGPSLAKSKVSL